MDMSGPYEQETRAHCPQAAIVYDLFHVVAKFGRDMVRNYVEGAGGTVDHPARRWAVFKELLSSPRLPSTLRLADLEPREHELRNDVGDPDARQRGPLQRHRP